MAHCDPGALQKCKGLRAARALFGKVSDDFLRQQILEDCPECGEVAAASPGVERLR
jgi:hypothetical protein